MVQCRPTILAASSPENLGNLMHCRAFRLGSDGFTSIGQVTSRRHRKAEMQISICSSSKIPKLPMSSPALQVRPATTLGPVKQPIMPHLPSQGGPKGQHFLPLNLSIGSYNQP